MISPAETTAPPGIAGCRWCGMYHGRMCPYVRSIEYDPPGSDCVKRVEFHEPAGASGGVDHKLSVTS